MNLNNYIKNRKTSQTTVLLIDKLKIYAQNDEEFIIGVLSDLESDEERQQVINYIDNGIDVSYENIILYALDIEIHRKK